jgi:ATP-dependent helicase/nuclease subunit A
MFDDTTESQALIPESEFSGVQVLTVHKSKGLEFNVVILPQMDHTGFESRDKYLYEREAGLVAKKYDEDKGSFEKSGAWDRIRASLREQDDAEALRLFYVAATRARERLIMLLHEGESRKGYIQSWKSHLVANGLLDSSEAQSCGITIEDDSKYVRMKDQKPSLAEQWSIKQGDSLKLGQPASEDIDRLMQRTKQPSAFHSKNLTFSVWQLVQAMCPGKMAEYQVEINSLARNMEEGENDGPDRRTLGTIVHNAMERIDLTRVPGLDEVTDLLGRVDITGAVDEADIARAAEHILQWFDCEVAQKIRGGNTAAIHKEYPFAFRYPIGEYTLTMSGTIDLLIEFSDGSRWLVDFKYADYSDSQQYELQMLLYSLAVKVGKGMLPDRAILSFLKSADLRDVPVDQPALDEMSQTIKHVLKEIAGTADL